MNEFDSARLRRSEARNNLDSKYYGLKDKIENDKKFLKYIRDDEKNALSGVLSKLSEWLDDIDEDTVTYEELQKKLDEIEKIDKPVFSRMHEYENLPKAVKALQSYLGQAQKWSKELQANFTSEEDRGPTNDDLLKLDKLCQETVEWISSQKLLDEPSDPKTEPIIKIEDVKLKGVAVRAVYAQLSKKKPPPKKTSTTATTTSSSSSASPSSTATSEEETNSSQVSPEASSKPSDNDNDEEKVEL
jgi:cell division septation protein DedD